MDERLPTLSNPRSDRMRQVASLGRRSFRARKGLLRVEGPNAVKELLLHREQSVRDVYFTEPAKEAHAELYALAVERTRWTHLVEDPVFRHVAPESQGVFAVCGSDAVRGDVFAASLTAPLVILPGTQDPGNAGSIIRSADAFGAAGVIACTGTVDPLSPKVIRASAGSVFHLPILLAATFDWAAARTRETGRLLYGASGSRGSVPLEDADLSVPHAYVFGNEAAGLTAEEIAVCDQLVCVPMTGKAESLNVAVASAICLYASQEAV